MRAWRAREPPHTRCPPDAGWLRRSSRDGGDGYGPVRRTGRGELDCPRVEILGFFAIVFGYYTVKGSGISETPYGKVYSDAPGAIGPASVSGKDERVTVRDWSRGAR